MSWYKIFYWVSVADGVKDFFDTFSSIFTFFAVCTLIVYAVLIGVRMVGSMTDDKEETKFWIKRFGNFFWISMIICLITWAGYMLVPTKKDALIIIAGGAVGTFIMSDSSAKQIPAELTLLLREKMSSEIRELKNPFNVDTLGNKTREELIELLKKK